MDNFDLKDWIGKDGKFLIRESATNEENKSVGPALVALDGVGSALDIDTGTIHPMNADGTPDLDKGMEHSIYEPENLNKYWVRRLSARDIELINSYFPGAVEDMRAAVEA